MAASIRVVVADDHPIVLDGIQTLLAQTSCIAVVGTARSFPAVSTLLEQVEADVLILDLGGMGGSPLALLHYLSRDHPLLRVIVFSSTIDLAPELIAAGAAGYVAKEELPTTLITAISMVSLGEAFFSPLVQAYLEQSSTPSPLTPQELVVLKMLAQGLTTEEIASQMRIDPRSVQNYITAMRRKTGSLQRTQLVDWYRRTYDIPS